jgi:hypothetical protein
VVCEEVVAATAHGRGTTKFLTRARIWSTRSRLRHYILHTNMVIVLTRRGGISKNRYGGKEAESSMRVL